MIRTQFFNKNFEFLTIAQIAEITGSKIYAEVNHDYKIYDISTLEKANKEQISFLNSGQYFPKFEVSNAGACFIDEKYVAKAPKNMALLVNKNPYFAYAVLAASFYQEKPIDFPKSGLIHETAVIGENTRIAPNAYIGKNVKIGKNSYIAPSAAIMDNSVIGDNAIINAGVVISYAIIGDNCIFLNGAKIGQDGFGFAHNQGVNHKIIQLGIVEIGNNVEIGANSCIDRGALENTVIGDGTKIDNLVQIGHNVKIGKGTVIAGSSAVAGSAIIGNYVQVGGKASIAGHLTVNDGAKVAGMSGVARDVNIMQAVAGIPALPIRDWHKINAKLIKMVKTKND